MGLSLLCHPCHVSSVNFREPFFPPLSNSKIHQLILPSSSPQRLSAAARRFPVMNSRYSAPAVAGETTVQALRRLLESPGIHQGPVCHDALSAKLVERAGFPFCFMGGFAVSAAQLGLPDVGLISYGEMVDHGCRITQAVSIPVIGDGDNGYGNHMNVKRTVKGFIRAGFAGILLEDQLSPKACGHTRGRKVVSREEAVMRIKAAIDARKESGSDIVILARTDSRQAVSLEEALWRSKAFADAGADVIFVDALASRDEMKAFCQISPLLPKMDALIAIKGGRIPPPGSLPSFDEIKETVGFNDYYEEEERYKISGVLKSSGQIKQEEAGQKAEKITDPVVEAISPVYNGSGDSSERSSGIWSRSLRLKITGSNEHEKLNVCIPAGFLEGMANRIPGLSGINVMELLENAALESTPEHGKLLLDFIGTMGDRIQVVVE